MAAAGARTTWQRRANCCFVQEDAWSAAKFSSCPSSSSSKAESDIAPENLKPDCMPYNPNPELASNTKWWLNLEPNCGPQKEFSYEQLTVPNPELASNTKWWLNLEPNCGPQKEFSYEQLTVLEAELEVLNSGFVHKTPIISDYYQSNGVLGTQIDMKNSANSFVEQPCLVSVTRTKSDQNKGMQELNAGIENDPQVPKKKDPGEFWYSDDHLMNLNSLNCLSSEEPKKMSSSLESQWVGTEKTELWWRSTGKDELASLVAQKSLEHIENCDLPRPQVKHRRKGPSAFDPNSAMDQMAEMGFSNMDSYTWGSFTSGHSTHESCSPLRDEVETQNNAEDNRTKAELLEALCHSQTRARNAEKAAKQAHTEKEHIITLFLKQASQLFAYKQWLQLLQLEKFCLQLNNKDQPWSPHKGRHMKKGRRRAGKRGGGPRCEINTGVVAFAVGLGLAGAGLLLGWTMGWLFPTV